MISRQEAAELLDCQPQTVSNWVEKGVINGHKVGGHLMIDRNSIEQYFDSLKDLADMEKRIKDLKSELNEKYEEMKATLDELRIPILPSDRVMHVFRENQMTMIRFWGTNLNEFERIILEKITKGESTKVFETNYGLSHERVVQIGLKAAAKISDMADFKQMVHDHQILQKENDQLCKQNAYLKERLSEYENERKIAFSIFQKRMCDLPFASKTVNALKNINCETLGDLVKLDKTDLKKVRNIGNKSLTEIEDFITSHGLHWGMRLDLMSAEELASYNDKIIIIENS